MGKKYINPPVVEAICEFQFIPGQPWDMTVPGLFYEKIKGIFPVKEKQVRADANFQPKGEQIEYKLEMSQRMQFFHSDRSALIQLGADFLAVNHLKPYPAWKTFRPLILDNLKEYQGITNPKGFKRIGLCYVNKIEFDRDIEMADYFNYFPPLPSELPQHHGAFNIQTEIPYEDERDRLLLTLASSDAEPPNSFAVLLVLDYIMAIPESILIQQVPDWIDSAHTTIENAFEACITDKCRYLFGEER